MLWIKEDFEGKKFGKKLASIFWGFCNKHDSIFQPIEIQLYSQTLQQNFLFAYRGLVVSLHKKIEASHFMNYGVQSQNDIKENKKNFDNAILGNNFSIIETEIFELPAFYPISVSSAFNLDFDFEGKEINHSDERMEYIFITLFPLVNKTYFLLSYLKQDKHLYKELGNQLRKRNKLKSDITMLIAGHSENVFFNPTYFKIFIEKYRKNLGKVLFQTQMNHGTVNNKDEIEFNYSFTPKNYLENYYDINFFGY